MGPEAVSAASSTSAASAVSPWAIVGSTALMAGAGALTSFSEADARNDAVRSAQRASARSIRRSVRVTEKQLVRSAALEETKIFRQGETLRSRIRAASGEALGGGGTTDALIRQTSFDERLNREILGSNLQMSLDELFASGNASLASLQQYTPNPLFAGIFGGMEGIGTGLQVAGGIRSLSRLGGTAEKLPTAAT